MLQLNKGINFIVILSFTILFIENIKATNKPFTIVTTQWDKYTNSDGSGLYFDILNEVFGKNSFSYSLAPWKRAQSTFSAGTGDSLLGESASMDYCQYPKWPIDADFFSAYHLKSRVPHWPGANKLKDYKVIWVRGYELGSSVPGLKPFAEVDDNQQGIKMIIGGRADILIDYDQDLKDYRLTNKLDEKENLVSPTDISGGYIYLCFRKGEAMKPLMNKFDEKMAKLKKNGQLLKIFKKYDREKNYKKLILDQSN